MINEVEKNKMLAMLYNEKNNLEQLKKKLSEVFLNENQENYIQLYLLYRELFTKYIINKLNLNLYDEELKKSSLNFIPVSKENMDFYQYFSNSTLSFFYIRNNLYLETLDQEELLFLNNKLKSGNFDLDDNSKNFIEKTFRKVTFEDILQNGSRCLVFYGPNNSSFAAENDAIIIGFRYDRFKNNGLEEEQWLEIHDKQDFYLYNFLNIMETKFKETSSIPIKILKYNEFSVNVKKKN